MRELPSFNILDASLSYDPISGLITWKHRDWVRKTDNTRLAGKVAGTPCTNGYLQIHMKVENKFHVMRCHRVAWVLTTGEWPSFDIDHVDGNGENNKWKNLRLATKSQNAANKAGSGKDGQKGCYLVKKTGKWRSYITLNKKQIYIGTFHARDEAAEAYRLMSEKIYGEFAHHLSS